MTDFKMSHKKYEQLLRRLRSNSAAATTLPRVTVRDPYSGGIWGPVQWFPSILLSTHVTDDSTAYVLKLDALGNRYRRVSWLYGASWDEWPAIGSMEVPIGNVRLLAVPDPNFEAALAELDHYFTIPHAPRDKAPLRNALRAVAWTFNDGMLPQEPPADATQLVLPPSTRLQRASRLGGLRFPEGFIL